MTQSILGVQALGLTGNVAVPSTGSLAISASTTRLLFTFVPLDALTLNNVRFFVSAVSGSLGASDISVDLVDFPAGAITATTAPNAAIETRATVTTTPTGAAWVEVTGFTTALTAGKVYGIVIKNANGTPASNNFTVRWLTDISTRITGTSAIGWRKASSTDSGSTYGSSVTQVGGVRLEFSDTSVCGIPVSDISNTLAGDGIYSGRELGVKFTTPADAKLRVKAVTARVHITGTPTGLLRFRLYQGTSLVASTATFGNWQSTQEVIGVFASVQVLEASTLYRVVLAKDAGDANSSSNRVNLYELTVENDAASKALLPFGGWVKTYWDGASWTDTDTSALMCGLLLDTSDAFDATSSGGGGGARVLGGTILR